MVNNWGNRSARAERLTPEFYRLRPIVLRRDAEACQWRDSETYYRPRLTNTLPPICGAWGNHVDHIIPSGADTLDNLQTLCEYHHHHKTALEGNAARWQHTEARPRERHSGIRRTDL